MVVVLVAGLSVVAWVWAVRRPAVVPEAQDDVEPVLEEPVTPTYVAIGNTDVNSLFSGKEASAGEGWAHLLHQKLDAATAFHVLAGGARTLMEANADALPAVAALKPTLVTLWNVVGDSTGGTSLTSYLAELRKALDLLTSETEARIVLLMLPDITRLMQNQTEERKALIRGGIEQWNRVIAEAATRYGSRVMALNVYNSPQVMEPGSGNEYLADLIYEQLQY